MRFQLGREEVCSRVAWPKLSLDCPSPPQVLCKADPYLLEGFEPHSCEGHCLCGCAMSNWAFNQPNCCLTSQPGGPGGLLNMGACAGATPARAPACTRCLLPACIPPCSPSPKNVHPFAGQTLTLCVRLLPLHARVPAFPKKRTMKFHQIGIFWRGLSWLLTSPGISSQLVPWSAVLYPTLKEVGTYKPHHSHILRCLQTCQHQKQ